MTFESLLGSLQFFGGSGGSKGHAGWDRNSIIAHSERKNTRMVWVGANLAAATLQQHVGDFGLQTLEDLLMLGGFRRGYF